MDSFDRADFLANLKSGGRYERTVAIYRTNESSEHVGVFDRALLEGLPSTVRWIAHNGAGYDQIDIRACTDKGITVSNTPAAVDDATATTALLRAGHWKSDISASLTHDLTGKTLAILGLGGIGFRLAELAHAFPMRVVYHSRKKVEGAPDWCEYFGRERMDEFLSLADVLSVHVPLRLDTEHLVDEGMIRKLKKGAVLVNTARGKVVDESALVRALEDGHLGAVGLDVYPNEPVVNSRLLDFPNVALLPHMGTETRDTQKKMEVRALTNIRDYLVKGEGNDIVPEQRKLRTKLMHSRIVTGSRMFRYFGEWSIIG
ncbi:D-isomer specific 2-hydroxyacid dehydrogenase [Russula dissimulans]|nr:D-isomer specific 2-hydroxyacid dehydrogenase [Russula dissimulans]